MKRIGKKVREEAILICDIAASYPTDVAAYNFIARDIGASDKALELASAAWSEHEVAWAGLRVNDATAAQFLREGWAPT